MTSSPTGAHAPAQPPVAARRPQTRSHHGDDVVDEYEWLRDKEDPEVRAYLDAENAYATDQTAHLEQLRETVFDEIRSRTLETDLSVPVRHGGWWYYTRTREGSQYAIRCRRPVEDAGSWDPPVIDDADDAGVGAEQVLLDSNVEAEGTDFFSLGGFSISDDGDLLAYSTDTVGDERYTIRVKDLRTGELLADVVSGTSGGVTWSAGATHLFYTTVDDAWRPHQVWRHALGTDAADDVVVHTEDDERFFTGVGRTSSERFLVIGSSSKITSESRVLAADDPEGEFAVVVPRTTGVEYSIEHSVIGGEDWFLLLHNAEHLDFALDAVPVEDALAGRVRSATQGRAVIAGRPDVRLEDIEVFAHTIAVSYRRDALARIGILPLGEGDGLEAVGEPREIEFGEELFTSGIGGNAEWDQPLIRVGFGSFVTPGTVYDYDVAADELVLRKQAPVLGDYDPDDYEQHQSWATAPDGVRVPVSIVARKDTPRDGTAPALLYGYGSYEASMDPGMSISRLSLLDRGFVFAIAHVRGGGELGRHWYDDGKMLAKKNTFTDFVAAAEHVVAEGWTSADRLVAEGGSAGGLLMGAVANLAPQAFCGIVAAVPFVDALTSILDPDLPLTVIEWDEWGDPLHDPDVYAYMKSYTPYENVTAQDYPAILAVTSLHDTRVLFVEPAKWVARLRATATGDGQVLLKTEMNAGHGGVSGRYAAWRERAWELAWIIDTAGRATSTSTGA